MTKKKKECKDYTKDFIEVSNNFYKATIKIDDTLESIKESMKEINDKNILHQERMTRALGTNSQQVKNLELSLKGFQGFLTKQVIGLICTVFKWIIIALIAIAGVNKLASVLANLL